jgi:hypothetical protein
MRTRGSNVRRERLEEMAAEAMVDCYTESEMFAAWACVLEDELPLPLKCCVLGEEALLVRIEADEGGGAVLGIITKGKDKIRIPIQDMKPVSNRVKGIQWLDAYRHWLGIM